MFQSFASLTGPLLRIVADRPITTHYAIKSELGMNKYLLILLFLISFDATSDIYKCRNNERELIFSDKPCSANAEIIKLDTIKQNTDGEEEKSIVKNPLIGKWSERNKIYEFKSGGRMRSEEYYGGKLVVWRTGSWILNGNNLRLHFTNSGGPMGGGKMNYKESGNISWSEDNNSFDVRIGGVNTYFSRKN